MKIIGNIFEESDYSVFKRMPDNRNVTQRRLDKLIESFQEMDI